MDGETSEILKAGVVARDDPFGMCREHHNTNQPNDGLADGVRRHRPIVTPYNESGIDARLAELERLSDERPVGWRIALVLFAMMLMVLSGTPLLKRLRLRMTDLAGE
ncbi:hypothetical protein [Antarcticimicrobium sediminis]|uniref:Uncharacterized protein n=1 Tax=Antarcticimicrobium sediminis TaxID=2546227 RepID=A0A4R5EJQ8_9RHOB|nr:hypothetical protein [Antarcticimicrobium sediminis]TDE34642.1 hypothetical protein E1B25_19080 [Antarcticimicrobium sediminis]